MSVPIAPKRGNQPLDTHGVNHVRFTDEQSYKGKHLDRTYAQVEGPRKVRSGGKIHDRVPRGINPFDLASDAYYANGPHDLIDRASAAQVGGSQIPAGKGKGFDKETRKIADGVKESQAQSSDFPDEKAAGWLVAQSKKPGGAAITVSSASFASWDLLLDDLVSMGKVKAGSVRFDIDPATVAKKAEEPPAEGDPTGGITNVTAALEGDSDPAETEDPLDGDPVAADPAQEYQKQVLENMNAAIAADTVQTFEPLGEGQSGFEETATPDNVKTDEEPKAQEEPRPEAPSAPEDDNLE